jgi:hypothetical protein
MYIQRDVGQGEARDEEERVKGYCGLVTSWLNCWALRALVAQLNNGGKRKVSDERLELGPS